MSLSVTPANLSHVDGSVRLECGNTTVIASVTGPIEPKIRQELPTQASLEIIVRPSKGLSSTREKVLEDLLRSVLQSVIVRFKYPRQLIQIVVQFLTTDGDLEGAVSVAGDTSKNGANFTANESSAALNACFFALIDANVALYNSFASVTLAVDAAGHVVDGPTLPVLEKSRSHHVVCFDIREQRASKILLVESNGTFTEDELVQIVERASKLCEQIHKKVQRPTIETMVNADFVWAS